MRGCARERHHHAMFVRRLGRVVTVPGGALAVEIRRVRVDALDRARGLEELHRESFVRVPRDVAVHEPGARVVGLEGEGEPAAGGQHGDVAARWVVVVQGLGVGRLPGRGAGAEDEEVVAVQVDGVRHVDGEGRAGGLLDHPVRPLAFGGERDDVGVAREGGATRPDGFQGRVRPVDVERGAVDVPVEREGSVCSGGLVDRALKRSRSHDGSLGHVRIPIWDEASFVRAALRIRSFGGRGAGAEDEEVVAVQVDGVRHVDGEGRAGGLLDHPVRPLAFGGERDDVGVAREGGATRPDGFQGRVRPVDVERGAVDVPVEREGSVCSGGLVDRALKRSRSHDGSLGHVRIPIWDEASFVRAALRIRSFGGSRGLGRVVRVGEDGLDVTISKVGAAASLVLHFSTEPITARSLVSSDDDIVALTDPQEDPRCIVGYNRHKISSNHLHLMSIQADHKVVIDGCVDNPDAMPLPRCESGASIGTAAVANHGPIDQAIVSFGWASVDMFSKGSMHVDAAVVPISDGSCRIGWPEKCMSLIVLGLMDIPLYQEHHPAYWICIGEDRASELRYHCLAVDWSPSH
nr:hypothetical protein CFP56_29957 [Quercus suber]